VLKQVTPLVSVNLFGFHLTPFNPPARHLNQHFFYSSFIEFSAESFDAFSVSMSTLSFDKFICFKFNVVLFPFSFVLPTNSPSLRLLSPSSHICGNFLFLKTRVISLQSSGSSGAHPRWFADRFDILWILPISLRWLFFFFVCFLYVFVHFPDTQFSLLLFPSP